MNQTDRPVVVPIAVEHIEGFHRALDVVARERRYLAFLEAPPIADTRDFIMGCIERGDAQFVALAGGEVVGWCDIARLSRPIHRHRGTLGMGIIPAYRGAGLGLELIATALAHARGLGLVRIELTVYTDNLRAVALYEKVGFVREGVQRDAAYIDGAYRDSIVMAMIERGNRRE